MGGGLGATDGTGPPPALSDFTSVIEIEECKPGRYTGRPPRYQPGDNPAGTEWTVVRSVDEDGFPLVSTPTAYQVSRGIRGNRLVECVCNGCGFRTLVLESNLNNGHSTACRSCIGRRGASIRWAGRTSLRSQRPSKPTVDLAEIEREARRDARAKARRDAESKAQFAEAQAIAAMERRQAADLVRFTETARVSRLRRLNGLA